MQRAAHGQPPAAAAFTTALYHANALYAAKQRLRGGTRGCRGVATVGRVHGDAPFMQASTTAPQQVPSSGA